MKSVAGTSVAAIAAALAWTAAPVRADEAKVGEKAPDFCLKDTAGGMVKLSDLKGKTVVLQWVNPGCPFCKRVAKDVVAGMLKKARAIDETVVHLPVSSNHNQSAEQIAKYLEDNKVEAKGLMDQDGTVGHAYGAKTTPHMFVIDGEGVLRYEGAIDDDPDGEKKDGATNYVVNAVQQIKAGGKVSPDSTKSYGCGVKYGAAPKGGAVSVSASKFKPGSCCDKAAAAGGACSHPCCQKAAEAGAVCEKCNAGAPKAAVAPKFKAGGCCDKAAAGGGACSHPCCKKAAEEGKVCEKCNS